MKTVPCGGGDPARGCGKSIVWGVDANGTRIPLDPRAPVYRLGAERLGGGYYVARQLDCFVNHFCTCPKAGQFSGRNAKKGGSNAAQDAPVPGQGPGPRAS